MLLSFVALLIKRLRFIHNRNFLYGCSRWSMLAHSIFKGSYINSTPLESDFTVEICRRGEHRIPVVNRRDPRFQVKIIVLMINKECCVCRIG